MLDMIKPIKRDCITLTDLKRCKMTPIFFDTFFNLEKYMEHEQRDPFAQKEGEEVSPSDSFRATSLLNRKILFSFAALGLGSVCRPRV